MNRHCRVFNILLYTSGQQINFCEQLTGQVTNWQITLKVLEKQKGQQTNKDNLTFPKNMVGMESRHSIYCLIF